MFNLNIIPKKNTQFFSQFFYCCLLLWSCVAISAVSADPSCPPLSLYYGSSNSSGTYCAPTYHPTNEVCKMCSQVQVPIAFCPVGYTAARDENYPNCVPCPAGYYCPLAGDTYPISCPAGYYCPKGSYFPRECYSTSACPENSSRYTFLGGILGDGLILIASFISMLLVRKYRAKRESKIATTLPIVSTEAQSSSYSAITPSEANNTNNSSVKATTLIDIRFEDLGYSITTTSGPFWNKKSNEKVILNGISGEFKHGTLTSIMGPSGAGKTSLVSVICGKVNRTAGHIYVNETESEIAPYRKIIGLVPQDDIMLRNLTVEEVITHSARTRLPSNLSDKEILTRVDKVINILGLSEIRHQKIGDELKRGISGGQRKRVNIGLELVADTAAIILDEPTSGLDSSSAEEVMNALRRIAASGINVIAVIHQPRVEIYDMFDRVLLLGKGGSVIYFGETKNTLPYFESIGFKLPENTSPPDFIMDVLSCTVKRNDTTSVMSADLFQDWRNHCETNGTQPKPQPSFTIEEGGNNVLQCALKKTTSFFTKEPAIRKTASFPKQIFLFMIRSFLQIHHGFSRFLLDNALFAFTGLYIGISFIDPKYQLPIPDQVRDFCPTALSSISNELRLSNHNLTFFKDFCSTCLPLEDTVALMSMYTAMGIGVMATAVAVRTFGDERVVYWRDASSGINTLAYFIGKCITDTFKFVFFTWTYLSIFFLVSAPYGTFANYFASIFCLIWCMSAIGYLASMLFSKENAGFLAVMIGIIWSLTCGFVFSVDKMFFFGDISFPRWFGEAIFATETEDISYGAHSVISTIYVSPVTGEVSEGVFDYGNGVINYASQAYGYTLGRIATDNGIVFICGLVLRILAYLGLRYTNRLKQA